MEIYSELPEEKLKVASDLIEQAAFMAITLADLAEAINEEGVIEEYTNGANQTGRKISSNAKMYSTLISKYESVTSKLLQLIPKRPAKRENVRSNSHVLSKQTEEARKWDEQREKEEAFLAALSTGKIQQSDYHAFMAGEITIN